jgi:hypothetical protein
MIIICNDWEEYELIKNDISNLTDQIDMLAVKNDNAFSFFSPGSNDLKETCTFDLIMSKIGLAHWFCTLATLCDGIKEHFTPTPAVEISLKDIAKKFDIPIKSIKIID